MNTSGSISAPHLGAVSGAFRAEEPTIVVSKPSLGLPVSTSAREYVYKLASRLLIGDWVVVMGGVFVGLLLRDVQRQGWIFRTESVELIGYSAYICAVAWASLFVWCMMLFRAYERGSLYRLNLGLKSMAKALLVCSLSSWAYIGLFHVNGFSPRVGVVYSGLVSGALFIVWRLLMYGYLLKSEVRAAASSRVIFIGWSKSAEILRKQMRMDLWNLSEAVGCVPLPGGLFAENPPKDLAVLGDYSDLPRLAKDIGASSVVLADMNCSPQEVLHLIKYCQREHLEFKMVPNCFPALSSGLEVQTLSGVPLLGVQQLPLSRLRNLIVKRLIDIVGACVGIMVSGPIIAVFGAIVYFESPGPIIYRQLRTSRNGRNFYIYKIRSMKIDAENSTGAVWCKKVDDRRLKIGAFMRRANVDELPQFWNVLKGDMSLVGPRPERPELIEKFKGQIPNYNARHVVRAGLTGWAQVNGWRGDTDLGKRVEADLYYIENWSLGIDLFCIMRTLFSRRNAY